MPIPSPVPEKKAYEKEVTQEMIAFAVAIFGLAAQVITGLTDKARPGVEQRLALALYGPDRDQKLYALGHEAKNINLVQSWGWAITLFGIFLLFLFRFLRAKKKDVAENQMKNPEGLRGCAHVLYATLKNALDIENEDGSLRVTVFRVTEAKPGEDAELEQAINYVGTEKPSGMGRRFPIHVGVIGLTARTGEAQIANRQATDDAKYKDEMVKDWGYTEEMASKMKPNRCAFIAVPVKGLNDEVIGIVYADSSKVAAFDNLAEEFVAASTGFAAYIEERFE